MCNINLILNKIVWDCQQLKFRKCFINKHTFSYSITIIPWWETSVFLKSFRTLCSSVDPLSSIQLNILVTEVPTWLNPSPVYRCTVEQHTFNANLAIVKSSLNFIHFFFIYLNLEGWSTYQIVVLITSFQNYVW